MNASSRFNAVLSPRRLLASVALLAIAGALAVSATIPAAGSSPNARIGSGATRVVVRLDRGLNATSADRYATYATMNTKTIDAIISRVNRLPPPLSGVTMCPMDVGASLTLSFYRNSSSPYAVVVADPGGCGTVTIRDYNAQDSLTGSAHASGGSAFSTFVAATFHIKNLQVL